jgi:hypothetical protein
MGRACGKDAETRNAYRILVGKPLENDYLEERDEEGWITVGRVVRK